MIHFNLVFASAKVLHRHYRDIFNYSVSNCKMKHECISEHVLAPPYWVIDLNVRKCTFQKILHNRKKKYAMFITCWSYLERSTLAFGIGLFCSCVTTNHY